MNEDDVARDIHRKIEREKALITAANAMRQSTNNPAVVSGLDTKIRDGRRNIEYLESRLNELEMKRVNAGMEGMNVDSGNGGYGQPGYSGQYGGPGDVGHQRPPNPQFAQGGTNARARTPKPNYSKLGMVEAEGPICHSTLAHMKYRSNQVGYATSRTSHPAYAVTIGIQTQCRKAV